MTNSSSSSLLSIVVLLLLTNMGECQHECRESRCGDLPIRFPFRLRDQQPHHCGYPGFDLTCNDKHETLLDLPASPVPIQFLVRDIYYEYNSIILSDPNNCFPLQFLKLNHSSISPFTFPSLDKQQQLIPFFNCSPPQNKLSCPMYAAYESTSIRDLLFCTKLFDVWSTLGSWDMESLNRNRMNLWWLNPDCSQCEVQGKRCKLKNNDTKSDMVKCFDREPKPSNKRRLIVTGVAAGSIVLILVAVIAIFKICQYFRAKGEDYARVEKFLEDYRALIPTRFSYADLKRITSNFKEKLGEGAHGAVYKGKLSNEILVAIKMLNTTEGDGKEFINEVGTMGKIHHVNVVRLLGFCADGFHRALVYNFFPNGSLQNFISPPHNRDTFLGWEKLHRIALGVAKGIEYLHQGCDQRILHFDINPHNVLLDDILTPKITDFGLAKLCSKYQSAVSITAARGTLGYIAPELLSRNFRNVSYKCDVYSYGMLLIEMVGGRKNTNMSSDEDFHILYPNWIHNLLEGRDVRIPIEEEGDSEIAKKLAIVGLWCIQWNPVNRPSMKIVVQMLEGEGDNLAPPANPFETLVESTSSAAMIPAKGFNMELETIRE